MTPLKPFQDDSASESIGGMTVENGLDRLALYGNLDITRDKAGLALARRLAALAQAAVEALSADKALPDEVSPPKAATTVKNPFA